MKNRKGWSAMKLTGGINIPHCNCTDMKVAAAASVPCSFTSKKDLCTTLDTTSLLLGDMPEKSLFDKSKASSMPILIKILFRS
uniref:Uncharacterized protein n=1 Tax=Anguilla anguilla TaxID=7936 RepID=A0A0E9XRQ0_ANGAN